MEDKKEVTLKDICKESTKVVCMLGVAKVVDYSLQKLTEDMATSTVDKIFVWIGCKAISGMISLKAREHISSTIDDIEEKVETAEKKFKELKGLE